MICKHCGREIQDNEKRCPYCNTPVIRIKVKRICAYCKTEIKKGDKACPGCGRKVPEKVQEMLKREEEQGGLFYSEDKEREINGWDTVDFKLLMLSIFPPLLVIFFQILFAKTGFAGIHQFCYCLFCKCDVDQLLFGSAFDTGLGRGKGKKDIRPETLPFLSLPAIYRIFSFKRKK